jgi:hypothetical protein
MIVKSFNFFNLEILHDISWRTSQPLEQSHHRKMFDCPLVGMNLTTQPLITRKLSTADLGSADFLAPTPSAANPCIS